MLSLAKFVLEEGSRPPDFGERFPPPVKSALPSRDLGSSEFDRVFAAIRSSSRPLILWGLTQYPSLCQQGKQAFKLLPTICSLFINPQRALEYAAITCVNRLLTTHARAVSGVLFLRILDRLDACPASEYIQALARVLPCCTPATVEGCIFPLIVRFIGRDEPFQYAVGELFTLARFEQILPKPDLFERFIASSVIVNEYLANLIRFAAETGNVAEDWCCRLYPAQLMTAGAANPAIRLGVVKVIVQVIDFIHPSTALTYLVTALQWGEDSPEIALFLLEQADAIVTAENVQIVPGLHALLGRVASSSSTSILCRIPRLLGLNPTVLLGSSIPLEPIINALGSHPDPAVRLALLDSYLLLFARVTGRGTQDALLSAFMHLFDNPSPALKSKLAERDTYAFFGPGKLTHVIPSFARLISTLQAWRDIEKSAETFLSFPLGIVHEFWQTIMPCMLDHFTRQCHPLARCAVAFLPRLYAMLEPSARSDFSHTITRVFSGDSRWGVRRLLPLVIGAMAEDCASAVLPPLQALLGDAVPSVTVAALTACARIRAIWTADGVAVRQRIFVLLDSDDDRVRCAAEIAVQRQPSEQATASLECMPDSPEPSPRLPVLRTSCSMGCVLPSSRVRGHSSVALRPAPVIKPGRGGALLKPKRRIYGISQLRLTEPRPE
jgi:hypothetical protein